MTPLRASALVSLALLALAGPAAAEPTAEWYKDTGSGGALAQPPEQGAAGGSVAPVGGSESGEAPAPDPTGDDPEPSPAPIARPAQAEPVLGAPGDESQPSDDSDEPSGGRTGVAGTAAAGTDAGADRGAGSLPFTGRELAAVLGAGLLLLAAGAALRPRRA